MSSLSSCSDPAFIEADVPGQGRGLLATRQLREGDVVLEESPLFTTPIDASAEQVSAAVRALRPPQQAAFLALSSVSHAPSLRIQSREHSTFVTNCVELDDERAGVFPTIARINHACAPNVRLAGNEQTGGQRVVVLREVQRGEQLFLTYTDLCAGRAERQAKLRAVYDISCTCSVCELKGAALAASDDRRARIAALEGDITRALSCEDVASVLDLVEQRLALLDDLWTSERVRAPAIAAWTCARASEAATLAGDAAKIRSWSTRALHYTLLAEGADSDSMRVDNVREMLKLLEQQQ